MTNRTRSRRLRDVAVATAAFGTSLALTVALGPVVTAQTSADPRGLPLPEVTLHQDQKQVLVQVDFSGPSHGTLASAQVLPGRAHGRLAEPPYLRLDSVGQDGSVLESAGSDNPVHVLVQDASGAESLRSRPTARARFYVPFHPQLRRLAVHDREHGVAVGSYDLEPAIAQWCDDHPADLDCRTDLVAGLSDAPDPAVAGLGVTYTASVRNAGPNPAHHAGLVLTVPDGLTPGALPSGCSALGQLVRCSLGLLTVGQTRTVAVPAAVRADLVHLAGAPVDVVATSRVTNGGSPDLVPGNDVATATTRVVAVADLAVDGLTLAAQGAALLGAPFDAAVTTRLSSTGPSSPMDAEVVRSLTLSPGLSAGPTAPVAVPALAVGAAREVGSTVRLTCTQPGEQTVTVIDRVRPARPDDTDPASANDAATRALTVDCVLPVALNVKPEGDPDPKTRLMPMAVLTTAAGEYGLPLPVDATRIRPLTVRFGPESLLQPGPGGSAEAHRRGHPEDSPERDTTTRDGDLDLVLHHPLAGSGLTADASTGCVKGDYLSPGGATWRFFGCDALRP